MRRLIGDKDVGHRSRPGTRVLTLSHTSDEVCIGSDQFPFVQAIEDKPLNLVRRHVSSVGFNFCQDGEGLCSSSAFPVRGWTLEMSEVI